MYASIYEMESSVVIEFCFSYLSCSPALLLFLSLISEISYLKCFALYRGYNISWQGIATSVTKPGLSNARFIIPNMLPFCFPILPQIAGVIVIILTFINYEFCYFSVLLWRQLKFIAFLITNVLTLEFLLCWVIF